MRLVSTRTPSLCTLVHIRVLRVPPHYKFIKTLLKCLLQNEVVICEALLLNTQLPTFRVCTSQLIPQTKSGEGSFLALLSDLVGWPSLSPMVRVYAPLRRDFWLLPSYWDTEV